MMDRIEANKIYTNALQKWGAENQIIVAVEELSELQKALCKYLRGYYDCEHIDNILEEMADVQIMLEQLQLIFGVSRMEDWKNSKIHRLSDRVQKSRCGRMVDG